jgi:membrane fusion protein, copper/silver efflux system
MLLALPILGWTSHGLWLKAMSRSASHPGAPVAFYQDSMHPWIKSSQPGKCTICGMELTPIYEGQNGAAVPPNVVPLSSNSISVLNVQTEIAGPRQVGYTVHVAGTLEANEEKKTVVAAPAAGRIDDLLVRYAGVDVHEGDRLVTFYSPELTLEKRRFLVRARMSVQRDPTGGLAQMQSDSDPYYSDLICPQTGTVIERNVYKGQYVTDGEKLFTIVDLSVLWFRFDVYEHQLPWLKVGQTVAMTVPSIPGKVFPAVISFIEPMLNELTRTYKVRADLQNPILVTNGQKQRLLGLGVYAQGDIQAQFPASVAAPHNAILFPGHAAYAFVDKGNGAYEKRRVRLGRGGDAYWEVLQGLEPGERVVTSGNVLLDAQAQINHASSFEELSAEEGGKASAALPALPLSTATAPAALADEPRRTPPEKHHASSLDSHFSQVKTITMAALPAVDAAPASQSMAAGSSPRHPTPANSPNAGPGFRNNRLGKSDAAFDAAFNRVAELRSKELTERNRANVANQPKLTAEQCGQLQALTAAADGLGQALADDDLKVYNRRAQDFTQALGRWEVEFGSSPVLTTTFRRVTAAGKLTVAKDLADARAQFVPLGAAMAELSRELKKQDPTFAGLKIFHCPMAPPPGLWIQAKGPLHNPFFGRSMLTCGDEVP